MATQEVTLQNLQDICSFCRQFTVNCRCAQRGEVENVAAAQAHINSPVIGGRYRLLECVGKGGMGTVYKARHESLEKTVAVKVLRADQMLEEATVRRFEREARAASSLNHPHLAAVYDYGRTEAGAPYLVMDFLDGGSLADLIRREGQVSLQDAVEIFEQIAGALAYAHSKGVIHRDLKPNNIILMKEANGRYTAKLVDFGIAKILSIGDKDTQDLTRAGEVFGSPLYMSPEQCLGNDLDERADIYSFGCLMYESLTGAPPFRGDNPVQTMYKHVHESAEPFGKSLSNIKLAAAVETIVLMSLQKDPAKRYQSMSALANDLSLIANGLAPHTGSFMKGVMLRLVPRNKIVKAAIGGIALFPLTALALTGIVALALLVKPLSQMNSPWFQFNNRAFQAYAAGNLPSAEDLMKKAIAAFPHDEGNPGQQVNMLASLAKIYFEEGNLAESAKRYAQAALVAEKAGLKDIAESCVYYQARCADRLGLNKEAAKCYTQAASLMEQRLGAKSSALLEPLASAGQRFFEIGDLKSSKAAYQKVVQIAQYNPQIERDLVATAYWYLACIAVQEREFQEASNYYDQAASIRISRHGPKDFEAQQIFQQKAMLNGK